MKTTDKLNKRVNKDERYEKKVSVRFPDWSGDSSRTMTVQELKEKHGDCLIIDPGAGEQVSFEDIINLNIPEVVAMPPIQGG